MAEPAQRIATGFEGVLAELRNPDCNAARVACRLSRSASAAFERMAARGPDEWTAICPVERPAGVDWIEHLPRGPARDLVAADLEAWVPMFGALIGHDHVRATLEVVATDACRKFHSDWVMFRAICTYLGPGTELIEDDFVARPFLATDQGGLEATNRAIVRDFRRVRRMRSGEWLWLKGEAWPGNEGRGAVHRSPPIAALGLRRVVVKLDSPGFGE